MSFVKNLQFFHLFILRQIGQEEVFYDILDRKNAFLDYKNIKVKNRRIGIFLKGLVDHFCQKLLFF